MVIRRAPRRRRSPGSGRDREAGVALLLAIAGVLAVSAVASAVSIIAALESRLAAGEQWRQQTASLARAAGEALAADLAGQPSWDDVLAGAAAPARGRGPAQPQVPGWTGLDVDRLTAARQVQADGRNRWGANGPRLRPYAWGLADEVVPLPAPSRDVFIVVWVADDPVDPDGDPSRDANGIVDLRVEGFGPGRARQALLATLRRRPHGVDVVSWRLPREWLPDP